MNLERHFSEAELRVVEAAIHEAENRSRAEIVIVATAASDGYEGAPWRGAAFGAVSFALAAGVASWFGGFWGGALWLTSALPTVCGVVLGYFLVDRVSALRRRFIAPETLERRVHRRAAAAFLEHEVFATRDRSGVLLFLSLFEHRAVVLGDSGINALVHTDEWRAVVADLCRHLHEGQAAAGLVKAVEACGELLDRRGLESRPDDRDELPNRVRLDHDRPRS